MSEKAMHFGFSAPLPTKEEIAKKYDRHNYNENRKQEEDKHAFDDVDTVL